MSYRKIKLEEDKVKFIAIHHNQSNDEFGIGGKDVDSNYFFVISSREKLIEIRDAINQALEENKNASSL